MRGVCYKRWKAQLSAYWTSGLSLAEYCRQNNLNIKTASKWRRQLNPNFVQQITTKPMRKSEVLDIVQVSPPPPVTFQSGITLEFRHLRITVDKDFDIPTLQRLLTALEEI